MTYLRIKGQKTKYHVLDPHCLGRECFQPGHYQHRGATGGSGSRNTGRTTAECMCRAYHGCPSPIPEEQIDLLKSRKAEGWKVA